MANLHSIETMGLLDGPGIRTVFFLSGCPLRCLFCHNPDTQNPSCGHPISTEQIVKRAIRMKPYFKNSGGVTLSGGEPMANGKFLLETILALKKEGIHVAVDTSGIGDRRYYEDIVNEADLILLDIKHYDPIKFEEITGAKQDLLLEFITCIKNSDVRIWIRHVMMPGYTDSKEDMQKLVDFVRPIKKNIDKLEILPYHTLGVEKYEELGIDYKLKGMSPMDKKIAKNLENYANSVLNSD